MTSASSSALLLLVVAAMLVPLTDGYRGRMKRAQKRHKTEYICGPNSWPDSIKNKDGLLEMTCHSMPIQCEEMKKVEPKCSSNWVKSCPPFHTVGAVKLELDKKPPHKIR